MARWMEEVRVVDDFLPSQEELAFREETVKVFKQILEKITRCYTNPYWLVLRAKIVL